MPAVTSEYCVPDGSRFAALDNNSSENNYLSLRHNRYWKHTMAAWASLDAFCSSLYGRQDSKNPLPSGDFNTDVDGFNKPLSSKSPSRLKCDSAEINKSSVNGSQNKFSVSPPRDDDSEPDKSGPGQSSLLVKSTSVSSLARDQTSAPSSSTETHSLAVTPISLQHDGSDVSQTNVNMDISRSLQRASSAMLNSNCQHVKLACGSSANTSNLDTTSQDNSGELAQSSTTPSSHSTDKQETAEVSDRSLQNTLGVVCSDNSASLSPLGGKRSDDSEPLSPSGGQCSDNSGPLSKLCEVCKEPYTNHKELVLLSPGLFQKTSKSRRPARREKRIMPKHKFLYRRRGGSSVSYSSLITSNFILAKALQTWVGRHLGGAKNVTDEDKEATNDSSNETETFSENLKLKLYELVKQIRSHAGSISSTSVTKEITAGSRDAGESHTFLRNEPKNEQRGNNHYDKHLNVADGDQSDADLQTPSDTAYTHSKGALENTPQPKEYNDSSQTTLAALSISDPQDMSNMRRNAHEKWENVQFQDICHKPGKAYIDNRKSRRKGVHGGRGHQTKPSGNSGHQQKMDSQTGTSKDASHQHDQRTDVAKRHLKRNEASHWQIMDDGRRQFGNRRMNYVPEKNEIEFPSRNLDEVVERKHFPAKAEMKRDNETAQDNAYLKQGSEQDKMAVSGKKFHYRCVKIGDRETIVKMEHNPNTICDFRSAGSGDKHKEQEESAVKESQVSCENYLEEKSSESKAKQNTVTDKQVEHSRLKPEKQKSIILPCREARPRDKGTEVPTEIAADEEDDDEEQVKYSKVFHKKYSKSEAERERRMIRRFALERLKANDERSVTGGEIASPRHHLPWPDIFTKLLKKRQKYSNKKCLTGKQAINRDDAEEGQENADEKPDDGDAATVHGSAATGDGATATPVDNPVETPGATNVAKSPPCSRSSNFLGLSFLDRLLRVPEPVQMTNEMRSEIEYLSHSKELKDMIVEYYTREHQNEHNESKKSNMDGEKKSPHVKDNINSKETDKEIVMNPKSKISQIVHRPLKSQFETHSSSYGTHSRARRGDSSKTGRGFSKTEKKINIPETDNRSEFQNNTQVGQTNIETILPKYDQPHNQAPTHLTPTKKFKSETSSATENIRPFKVSEEEAMFNEKSEKKKTMSVPTFVQKDVTRRKQAVKKPATSDPLEPTQLAPNTRFQIFSQSYNKNLKASAAAFFSKTIESDSKIFKKIMMSEGTASPQFKDHVRVQQRDREAAMQRSESEMPSETLPSHTGPNIDFKVDSLSHTKNLKALNEEFLYETKLDALAEFQKEDVVEEETSSQLDDKVYIKPPDDDLVTVVPGEAVDRVQGSELVDDGDAERGDFSETISQDVQAGIGGDREISVSQESLFQQIYSKLLEPVGLRIVDDLEQFGNKNRPLKYKIPASQRLYAPPGSRPVYLSEFLTWLGVRPTDRSSSDDEADGDGLGRNKHDHKRQQTFPGNVRVATSTTYLKSRKLDSVPEKGIVSDTSFISQDSRQIYLNEEGVEEISGIHFTDPNATSGQGKGTTLVLPGSKDNSTDPEKNVVKPDKDAAETPPSPSSMPDSKEVWICESSSKVFHKKYSKKEKLHKKERLGGELPWRKKDKDVTEGSLSKNVKDKKTPPIKNVFAKQADKSKERRIKEERVKKEKEKPSAKIHLKRKDRVPRLDCNEDDEIFEYQETDSNMDEQPCRVCLSSEDYKKTQDSSSGKGGDRALGKQYLKHLHQNLMVSSDQVGVDPESLALVDLDTEYKVNDDGTKNEDGLQQPASESYSMVEAVNKLLREIPIDLTCKKFLQEMISFRDRNIPLQFKVPSINERMKLQNAEPLYMSQFLSLVKNIRAKSRLDHGDETGARTSDHSGTSGQPDPFPKYVRRAGSLSHLMSRKFDHSADTSRRNIFHSVPAEGVSLSRDLTNVSNLQIANQIDQSISYLTSEASTVAESKALDISQTDTVNSAQAEPQECPKSPSRVFHKKYSTEGKIREMEKLRTWGEKPCRQKEEEEEKVCRCRESQEIQEEEAPPKKSIFSKQAERRRERERLEKMLEDEYNEFFTEKPCRDLPVSNEVPLEEDSKGVPGEDEKRVTEDPSVPITAARPSARSTAPSPSARPGDAPPPPPGSSHQAPTRADSPAAVKVLVDGKKILAGGSASEEPGSSLNPSSQLQSGIEGADVNDVVMAEGAEFTGNSLRFVQGVSEKMNLFTESHTTADRYLPHRYTIPSSCEMYQPPEARPIYMARGTSDKIMSFLGLRPEADFDKKSDTETFDRKAKRSTDRHGWAGGQKGTLGASPPWTPEVLTVDRILPYLKSKFMRSELPSTSSYPDSEMKRPHDFHPSDNQQTSDVTTRDHTRTGSPSHKDKTTAPQDSSQRPPEGEMEVGKDFFDKGLDKYRVSKIGQGKSALLDVVKEEDSQAEDSRRGGNSELFRWVGKSRVENIQMLSNTWLIPEEAQKLQKTSEVIPQKKGEVVKEPKDDPRSGSYFKGSFSKSFEESTIGAMTVKILDQLVDFGRRNIPLKFEARPQEFLEMPSAAKPIFISRKDLNKALEYLGMGTGDAGHGDEELCVSESSYSSEDGEPATEAPVRKLPDVSCDKKKVYEEVENAVDDEEPEYFLPGGTVESYRELTFFHPTVPLPRRFRWSSRRQLDHHDHCYQRTSGGFLGHRSRSQSKMLYSRREPICYGKTKQLRSRCDIWSKSELDRSSHFCTVGRYYRKYLFRKRLNLKNILKECEKGKEWRTAETVLTDASKKGGYSNETNCDFLDVKVEGHTSDADKKYKMTSKPDKNVPVCVNVSNCHEGVAKSKELDLMRSRVGPKRRPYNPDRCSHRREDDPWSFVDRRMVVDFGPEARGDYNDQNVTAVRNCCSSGYGHSLATVRNEGHNLTHSKTHSERTNPCLNGYSEMKRSVTGLFPFPESAASFGKSAILHRSGASGTRAGSQMTHRWRGNLSNWGGCHGNTLPISTTTADIKLGRSSILDVSTSQVVKPLDHQLNRYVYRGVVTRSPYTSSYYHDEACKQYRVTSRLPSRMY